MNTLPTPKPPVRVTIVCKKCGHTETFIGPNRDEVECNIAYSDWMPVVGNQDAYYLCAKCDKESRKAEGNRFMWRSGDVSIETTIDSDIDKTFNFYRGAK
jgi:hypothetical protein